MFGCDRASKRGLRAAPHRWWAVTTRIRHHTPRLPITDPACLRQRKPAARPRRRHRRGLTGSLHDPPKYSKVSADIASNQTQSLGEDRSNGLFKVADRQTVASLPGMLETGVIGREDAVVTERHRMPEEVIGDAGL
jgi:hypothetical protein